MTACCFVTRERKSDELKEVLLDIVRKAFKMRNQLEYNTSGNKFDDANEDIYKHDKSNSCCLGFLGLINTLFIFTWKIGIVYYCKALYLEGQTDSGPSISAFKDAIQIDGLQRTFDVGEPIVLAGVLFGAMLPYLFAAETLVC